MPFEGLAKYLYRAIYDYLAPAGCQSAYIGQRSCALDVVKFLTIQIFAVFIFAFRASIQNFLLYGIMPVLSSRLKCIFTVTRTSLLGSGFLPTLL